MDIQNFLSDLKISVATSSFSNVVLDGLGDILSSESLANIILILKAVGLLATLVMIYLVIFVVIKTNLISEKLLPLKLVLNRPNKTKDSSLAAEMEKIKKKIGKKDSAEDRTAVLAASQLLERGLAKVGQKSTLFRENVEGVPYWSSVNPDQIFFAYNIRTKMVHNPKDQVSHDDAEQAVEIFEKALKDLGVV